MTASAAARAFHYPTTMNHFLRRTLPGFGSLVFAGAVQAGAIQVTVTDKDGTAIPDVVVTVSSSSRAVARS